MNWDSIVASPEPGVNENRKASILFGVQKCPAPRLSTGSSRGGTNHPLAFFSRPTSLQLKLLQLERTLLLSDGGQPLAIASR